MRPAHANRPWSESEIAVLRAEYPGSDVETLADRLGRSPVAVKRRAAQSGIPYRGSAPVKAAAVVAMILDGLTDRAIADTVHRSVARVRQIRSQHRLPSNRPVLGEAQRARLREAYGRLLAERGVTHLRALAQTNYLVHRRAEERAFAERYGLPGDLRPVQVLVLIELARGPRTPRQLLAATGRSVGRVGKAYHMFGCPNLHPDRNYLKDLRRRGLVLCVRPPRGKGNGRGRGESLYLATPEALAMMAALPTTPTTGAIR